MNHPLGGAILVGNLPHWLAFTLAAVAMTVTLWLACMILGVLEARRHMIRKAMLAAVVHVLIENARPPATERTQRMEPWS